VWREALPVGSCLCEMAPSSLLGSAGMPPLERMAGGEGREEVSMVLE